MRMIYLHHESGDFLLIGYKWNFMSLLNKSQMMDYLFLFKQMRELWQILASKILWLTQHWYLSITFLEVYLVYVNHTINRFLKEKSKAYWGRGALVGFPDWVTPVGPEVAWLKSRASKNTMPWQGCPTPWVLWVQVSQVNDHTRETLFFCS